MVINGTYKAVKLYIFFLMWGAWHQLNVSALYPNSSLLSFTPHPFSILTPTLFNICLSLSPHFSPPSPLRSFYHFSPVSPLSLYPFFLSLKNSNDGRAFTVFTSFKTNMWHSAVPAETFDGSVLHSGLSELPALEHSCMLHYTIGQGTRKRMYEIQKKIKKKGGEMEEQGASS